MRECVENRNRFIAQVGARRPTAVLALAQISVLVLGLTLFSFAVIGCGGSRISVSKALPPAPVGRDQMNRMFADEVVKVVNDGRADLEDGLARLHELLMAEKTPMEVNGAQGIAEAAIRLQRGSLFENLARVIGFSANQSGPRLQLNQLMGDLSQHENDRHVHEVGGAGPAVKVLPMHKDAFLVRALVKKTVSAKAVFSYLRSVIQNNLDEAFRRNMIREGVGSGSFNKILNCTTAGYLPHFSQDKSGVAIPYDFEDEKQRFFLERDIDPATQVPQKSMELLAELSDMMSFIQVGVTKGHYPWLIEQFHFLVHAVDFRAGSGMKPPMRAFLNEYFSIWNSQPKWSKKKIGKRAPLTTRHYLNLMDDAKFQQNQVSTLASGADLAQSQQRLYQAIDQLNHAFDIHPKELLLDRQAACRDKIRDPKGYLNKTTRMAELTDKRFFEVLAPFWDGLAFGENGFKAASTQSALPEHPLSRIYYYRGLMAYHRAEFVRLMNHLMIPWQIQGLVDPVNLVAVFEDNLRKIRDEEIGKYYKKRISQPLKAGPQAVQDYLQGYLRIEVLRYLLDEDQTRKIADPTIRPGEAALRVELLETINEMLRLRHLLFMKADGSAVPGDRFENQYPDMIPVRKVVTQAMRLAATTASGFNTGDLTPYQFVSAAQPKIAPGIYEVDKDFSMIVPSAYIHPMALFFGPGDFNIHHGYQNGMRYVYCPGFEGTPLIIPAVETHPLLGPKNPRGPKTIQIEPADDQKGGILNGVLEITTVDQNRDAGSLVLSTRAYSKADLKGFRPTTAICLPGDPTGATYQNGIRFKGKNIKQSMPVLKVPDPDPDPISVLQKFKEIRNLYNP